MRPYDVLAKLRPLGPSRLRVFWRRDGFDVESIGDHLKCIYDLACKLSGLYIQNSGGHRVRPAKDAVNLTKHGISLADAADFDFAAAVVTIDDRFDYGEVRFRAFAYANGQGRCLAFAAIDSTTIRAISYRRARQKEMQRYGL
jgi:uncharacterized DUF497 family protein